LKRGASELDLLRVENAELKARLETLAEQNDSLIKIATDILAKQLRRRLQELYLDKPKDTET